MELNASLFVIPAILLLIPLIYWLCQTPKISTVPTASGHLPLIGNSVSYGLDPISFLKSKRAEHGDVFMVDLAILKVVFFLGPEATNQFFQGTERKGFSLWSVVGYMFGPKAQKCNPPSYFED